MTPALTPVRLPVPSVANQFLSPSPIFPPRLGRFIVENYHDLEAKKRDFQSGNYSITEEVDVLQQEAYQPMAYVILYTNIEAIYGSDVVGVEHLQKLLTSDNNVGLDYSVFSRACLDPHALSPAG
ncbi:uncharacterized protein TrAtP1_005689 [Trichoderma atroviride]|uniref:uncharacterized protein n=1 Tax=Hypocrea atroviridis TaxID=63577 RepID=UPI00332E312D|nr:hypothetical protein TrAtP1_005689 [Trichoderma atroviride]